MTVYLEIAQALVASGCLREADVDAAAASLANTMRLTDIKHQEILALDDVVVQKGVIAEAEAKAAAATETGDQTGTDRQQKVLGQAEQALEQDGEIIATTRKAIATATRKAADALVAAGLVDAAYYEDVIEVIEHAR